MLEKSQETEVCLCFFWQCISSQ